MKNAVSFLFIFILLISFSVISFANENTQEIKVYVNDTKVQFDVQPVFIQNRTMVPIRAVFEAMGAQVLWDNDTKTVTVRKGIEVKVQLDNPMAQVDNDSIRMEVPATGLNGRILVPVRFISEALGADVDWDNQTKTAYIHEPTRYKNLGNILNWGRFATDGVWNYHILEEGILIREQIETKEQEKISDHIVCDLHIVDDWIYCIGTDGGTNKVIRFSKINPENKEIIINESISSMMMVNGWIYYSYGDYQTLFRTDMEGVNTERILDNGDFSPKTWFVQDGFIYYRELVRFGKISRARINGTSTRNLIYDSKDYRLKLIDNEFLYVTPGNDEQGIYRLPLSGGKPVQVFNQKASAINVDGAWLYASIKTMAGNRLIKSKKDGTGIYTINEYKETDLPQNIYVNQESIYYSIIRGNEELMFQMSTTGQSISTLTWLYGKDFERVEDILTETELAHASLNSLHTLQMSTVHVGKETNTLVNEMKLNKSQSLIYQKLKTEEGDDLEVWMDKNHVYSKKPNETHWGIEQIREGKQASEYSLVFDLIRPTSELCNNLSISEQGENYILSGTGAFPVFMRNLFLEDVIFYENTSSYIDSITMEMVIHKNKYYIEKMSLKLEYQTEDQNGGEPLDNASHFQYANSQFNSVYLSLPYSVKQSLDAKQKAEKYIEDGKTKLNEGKYQEAIELFDTAIGTYDKSYDAYLYKGYSQYYHGRYEKAILTYEKYNELNPLKTDVYILQGMCYVKLGDLKKAKELAYEVLDTGSESELAYHLLGQISLEKEEFHKAYEFFEKAVSLDNTHYDAHINMVSTLFSMENYTKCIQVADEFLKRFHDNRDLLFLKARSLSRQGKSEEAIEVFQKILSMDPANDFVTMTYIALEYEKFQEYDKAQEYTDRAETVYPNYNLLVYLLETLDYKRFTLSSQKLVDFIHNAYLYYQESDEVTRAIHEFVQKGESYSIAEVEKLMDAVAIPEDNFTYVLSGAEYDQYINRYESSHIEMTQDKDTVYLQIKDFLPKTGVVFTEYIQNIEFPEEKTLILDLRNNSGGLSEEAGAILDTLLPDCVTSYFIERDGYISSNHSGKSHVPFQKIGILVNENTASSSELLALGLKMYAKNITIIGKPTVGRGVGQIAYVDRKKRFVLLLVNHYWNVMQKNIHGIGLPIDVEVRDDDPDYSKAVEAFIEQNE